MTQRLLSCGATAALLALLGCGSEPNAKKPDKVYTNQTALQQIEDDLKRNLDEVDKDPKLTPQQKEQTKKMMRDNVEKRKASFKEG